MRTDQHQRPQPSPPHRPEVADESRAVRPHDATRAAKGHTAGFECY